MSQGLERRAQPVDNLRGAEAVNPVTRSVPSVGTVSTPRTPDTSYGAQIAEQVSQFASGRLAEIQAKRQERSTMDGQIAAMQGASFESVETGGDKWALEGYRAVTAQTMSASLLRAQEADIAAGAYEQDPDTFRATLVDRIDGMVSGIDDERTRVMARDQLMAQMPTLIDTHTRQNTGFREQQNFDALSNSVDTLSRDASSTGALISFANGTSDATAGLSQERRRTAVVQGVINSFQNNNPAAYAHLEQADFFNTSNLTAAQLQTIESAKNAYHSRMEQSFSADWKVEWEELNDRITRGDVDPIVAAEEAAAINSRYGRRTSAAQAGGMYDAARNGVEFAEGTRGINARAAAVAGDYDLQARIMQGAVIHQESRGNPNAVSPVGATGIMQIMPATAANPGFGVRNIFQVARDMGVPVMGETAAVAQTLMRNEEVNKAMGTEYLSTMLERYNGSMPHALAAYNWGAGNADNWDGDMSKLPAETRGYITNIMGSLDDGRPNPEADRAAAELTYERARKRARLAQLEAMGPAMAQNDELFTRNEIPVSSWRATRQGLYDQYGRELDSERINQEQQMLRSVAGKRIAELQREEANVLAVQQGVQLEAALASADVRRQDMLTAYEAGTATRVDETGATVPMSLDEINQEYMGSILSAYTESGAELDAGAISKQAGEIVRESSDVVVRALRAQEERALISNAETAGTGGTLAAPLQQRMLDSFDERLGRQVANLRAENPDVPETIVSAMERQQRVQFIAEQGIVDEEVQQIINNAATGQGWINPDGRPNPRTVAALQTYTSIMAVNPSLAHQYVPDAAARGRMMAASFMVQSQFPSRSGFTDVDLANIEDPVTNAFYDAVQQVGLSMQSPPSAEETADRVARATAEIDSGNIRNTWFGGLQTDGPTESLTPQRFLPFAMLEGGLLSKYDQADVHASRNIDKEVVDQQYTDAVVDFLEEVVPHMPATSQQAAQTMAMNYVADRGAIMGSSFIMPKAGEPSIMAQMFPDQSVKHPVAVNTAIVNWMNDEAIYAAKDENGVLLNPRLNAIAESRFWERPLASTARAIWPFTSTGNTAGSLLGRTTDFTVSRLNGNYVMFVPGHGSIPLPIEAIGRHYTENR